MALFPGDRLVEEEVAPEAMAADVLNGDEAAEFVRALACKDVPRPSIEEVFPSVEALPGDGHDSGGKRGETSYRENLTRGRYQIW
jgi:hypothetical protein